jgi:hypothetical protein
MVLTFSFTEKNIKTLFVHLFCSLLFFYANPYISTGLVRAQARLWCKIEAVPPSSAVNRRSRRIDQEEGRATG